MQEVFPLKKELRTIYLIHMFFHVVFLSNGLSVLAKWNYLLK